MLSRRLLRTKVIKAVYAHLQCGDNNIVASEKGLVASIDKAYDLYLQMLALAPALVDYAEERQAIGLAKHLPTYEDLHPNRKFVENKAIARIAKCEALQAYNKKHSLGWSSRAEIIRSIYQHLCEQEFYKTYMASSDRSFREDAALLSELYSTILEQDEALDEVLEEQSILWSDDLGYVLTMVTRTIDAMREKQPQLHLLPKFKSDDDLDFAKRLFRNTVESYERNSELIDRYTKNWDVERVAMMDNIILAVAVAEMESFPSIPVKVSLNEYIDISKYYSTPSSSVFINGVLDRLSNALIEEGRINKSGKGLL